LLATSASTAASCPRSSGLTSENLLDQRQERVAGGLGGLDVGDLLWRQRRVEQQARHAEDAVQRRAYLVRHHGEEARLGAARRLRGVARLGKRTLGLDVVADIANDTLDFGDSAFSARPRRRARRANARLQRS